MSDFVAIFEKMNYSTGVDDTSTMTAWLKSNKHSFISHIDNRDKFPEEQFTTLQNANNENVCDVYIPNLDKIKSILDEYDVTHNPWTKIAAAQRAKIMSKLGAEIEKQQDLFIQLEAQIRGILSKDTKKVLPLLTDFFRYYSSFCVKDSSDKPPGLAVGIISNENAISALGYILGPALAEGYNVILNTDAQISVVAAAVIDIAIQVGVPENTIRLIPGDVGRRIFLQNDKVSVLTIFDNLHKTGYNISAGKYPKILHFNSFGIPMLIFEGCDLDSACHSLVNAAWGHKGMLPWSVRNILIQESVFDTFIQKVEKTIAQIKVGKGNEKNVDISLPDKYVLEKLETLVAKIAETHQPNDNSVYPTIVKGFIFENKEGVPLITLTAFRTINEAAELANNTSQGLGASVWTENLSLANEISTKLKVANIWFNSHGLFAVDVPFSPYKSSGIGFFGGTDGFCEYLPRQSLTSWDPYSPESLTFCTVAKKGHDEWYKLSRFDRINKMQDFAHAIDKSKSSWNLLDSWLKQWVFLIHDYVLTNSGEQFVKKTSFNVSVMREPLGIIVIESKDYKAKNLKVIIAALAEGNSVILLNVRGEAINFYSFIADILPKGVLSLIKVGIKANIILTHKEIDTYITQGFNLESSNIYPRDATKLKAISEDIDWNEARNKVTKLKSVWYNKTQSFM